MPWLLRAERAGFREPSGPSAGREGEARRGQRDGDEEGRAGLGVAGEVGKAGRAGTDRAEARGPLGCPRPPPRLPAVLVTRLRHRPLLGDAVNIRRAGTKRGAGAGGAASVPRQRAGNAEQLPTSIH